MVNGWSLEGAGEVLFHEWEEDDQGVVYNPRSGSTHLVDGFAVELLKRMTAVPQALEALTDSVRDFFEEDDTAAQAEFVESTLHQLKSVGLVVQKQI